MEQLRTEEQYVSWISKNLYECMKEATDEWKNYSIRVIGHRAYVKNRGRYALADKDILVVVTWLSGELVYNSSVRPVALNVWSEAIGTDGGTGEVAYETLRIFARRFDQYVEREGNDVVRHSYTEPQIQEPFSNNGQQQRAYMSADGTITETTDAGILDYLSIMVGDKEEVLYDTASHVNRLLSFTMAFANTPDTEMVGTDELAHTHSTAAVLSMTFAIPNEAGTLLSELIKSMAGKKSADAEYLFTLRYAGIDFGDDGNGKIGMRLINGTLSMDADENPACAFVFQR